MAFEQGYLTHPEYLVNSKWYETLNELEDISVDLIGKFFKLVLCSY